jgi:hypothetical protein
MHLGLLTASLADDRDRATLSDPLFNDRSRPCGGATKANRWLRKCATPYVLHQALRTQSDSSSDVLDDQHRTGVKFGGIDIDDIACVAGPKVKGQENNRWGVIR